MYVRVFFATGKPLLMTILMLIINNNINSSRLNSFSQGMWQLHFVSPRGPRLSEWYYPPPPLERWSLIPLGEMSSLWRFKRLRMCPAIRTVKGDGKWIIRLHVNGKHCLTQNVFSYNFGLQKIVYFAMKRSSEWLMKASSFACSFEKLSKLTVVCDIAGLFWQGMCRALSWVGENVLGLADLRKGAGLGIKLLKF